MSIPKIISSVSGFSLDWEVEQISIVASRLREHTDGRLTGEIRISSKSPEGAPHLHQAQFNFSSTTSRKTLSKAMAEQYNTVNWNEILEQLCVLILQNFRKGEPLVEKLIDINGSDIQRPKYLIYPFIIEHLPNCIFGDPGSLKSAMGATLSQVAILPWTDNELGLTAPDRSMKYIYLDYEIDERTFEYQLLRIGRGMKINPVVSYQRMFTPLAQDVERLSNTILESKAELLIIDSLAMASGGEPKETQPALEFFRALRQLKTHKGELITSLTIAHNPKGEGTKTIYGNQQYTAQMRNIWEALKSSEPESQEIDLALFHKKPPPTGRYLAPRGFHFCFDDTLETTIISEGNPKNIPEFLERHSLSTRIMEMLKGGPMETTELVEELHQDGSKIRARLSDLKKRGRVLKISGAWGLVKKEEV